MMADGKVGMSPTPMPVDGPRRVSMSVSIPTVHFNGDVVVGPSAISYQDGKYPMPVEASSEYISSLKQAWLDSVERCVVSSLVNHTI